MNLMNWQKFAVGLTTAVLATGLGACSKSRSGGGTDLVLGGTLGTATLMSALSANNPDFRPSATDLATLKMACVTLAIPPVAGSGDVDSTGAFSVTLSGSSGKKVGCFVLDADDNAVATLQFSDSSSTNMSGGSATSTNLALTGNVSLGAIVLDLTSGTAVVPVAQITATGGGTAVVTDTAADKAAGAWDISGTWKFAEYGDKPSSYEGLCPAGGHHNKGDNCNGPEVDQTVYFQQVDGVKTGTTDVAHGLMIWESLASAKECGDGTHASIGTAFATLSAPDHGGIDLSANPQGVIGAAYNYANAVTCGGSVTAGWKCSTATTQWDVMPGCGPVSIDNGAKQGNMCVDGASKIRVDLDGGCVDASTGDPVFIQDWNNVQWNTYQSISSSTESHSVEGHGTVSFDNSVGTVSYTNSAHPSLKCTHVGHTDTGFTNPTPVHNALCSTLTGLDALRCYANYYQNNRASSGCLKRYDFDWSASNPSNFEQTDRGHDNPDKRFVAELYNLGADGVGVIHQEQEDMHGVPAGGEHGTQWVNCRIHSGMTFTLTPADSTHATVVGTMVQEQGLVDMDKSSCVSYFVNQGAEKRTIGSQVIYVMKSKSMFQMSKQ